MGRKSLIRLPVLFFLILMSVLSRADPQDSAGARYEAGKNAQLQNNLTLAVEMYRVALIINPNYLEPLIGLAESFFVMEEYEEALNYLERAKMLAKNNLDLPILEGRIYIALNKLVRARELFEAVLARDPNNLEARYGLAELDIALGRKQNAARRYIESLKIAPQNMKALLSLALFYEASGNPETTGAYLELALKYHSNDPLVHFTAGRFSLNTRNLDHAENHLLTAISLNPEYREARRLLAHVHLLRDQSDEAIAIIKEILEIDRNDPLTWYILGLAYERNGNVNQAIHSLAQALRLRSDDEIARIALENIALAELPINDPVRKKYAVYHLDRGKAFTQKNFFDKAFQEYRRCLRLDPEDKEGRLAYAGLFKTRGFPLKYRQELEVLKNLGFNDPAILDDIEIIDSESYDTVSAKWGIDQYDLEKKKINVSIFHLSPADREIHAYSGEIITEYFLDFLRRYQNIRLIEGEIRMDSYESAFRRARNNESDFFLLIHYDETERSFTVRMEQYLSRTGSKLKSFRVFRTGNDRIRDSLSVLTKRFQETLPLKGTLLSREFDRGIIDLGRADGIKEDDRLIIIKNGRVELKNDEVGFTVQKEDILGDFTIDRLDENLAEGTIAKRDFFDLINPGDEVIIPISELQEIEKPPEEADRGLLRRLFDLIGL